MPCSMSTGQTLEPLVKKWIEVQRQNKLIQSQIDFEKIKKDLEKKKLKKRSDED